MKRLFAHRTSIGTFYICLGSRAYFTMLENKLLDSYSIPEQAARELAEHPRILLPDGVNRDDLAIPANLCDWKKL